jgi:hypothetical protein
MILNTIFYQGGYKMEFIKPKNCNLEEVHWRISEQVRTIIKFYAEYTEYQEDEVVDMFLKNILKDEGFIGWIEKKRNNKRLQEKIYGNSLTTEVI